MWRRRGGYVSWILRWRCVLGQCKALRGRNHGAANRFFQGVKQVKKTDLGARFLFLSPPSLETLEERLRGRGTDDEESVKKRLEQADKEMAFAKEEGVHDKIVVNDDLDRAYREVEEWVVDGGKYGGHA